jgi:phytoene synthase
MNQALLADLPPVQRLALAYASSRSRPAILSLLALDDRLAAILRGRREPIAAQLRLAWWRDMLARPESEWPAGEPVLETLRSWREPGGLASLAEGWEALLAEELTPVVVAEFVDGRAQAFASLARELGAHPSEDAAEAARIWALADLAANISDGAERDLVVEYGRRLGQPPRLSPSLRPLAVLAGLGAGALADGGRPLLAGPMSALTALRIGMTGR